MIPAEQADELARLTRLRDAAYVDYLNCSWATGDKYRRLLDMAEDRLRAFKSSIGENK